jgi:signal transduction histidine kinase
VSVTLVRDATTLSITVSDDGIGLDPTAATEGFGLIGMRERVSLAGGDLAITADPGSGTVVAAHLPLGKVAA